LQVAAETGNGVAGVEEEGCCANSGEKDNLQEGMSHDSGELVVELKTTTGRLLQEPNGDR
jgi:hypothetical protein